jgi:hypothetical protein
MKPHLQLEALIVCNDMPAVAGNQILGPFSINADVCSEIGSVIDTVTHKRLDTLIIDWDAACNPLRIVSAAKNSSPNRNATIVGLVSKSSEMQAALLAGAHFIIHKPTNILHASRCLRAAYGTMLQQRRRAARCPVSIPVIAAVAELGRLEASIIDISVGGLGVQCAQPVQVGWTISLKFMLPAANDIIHITGKVVNADQEGRAGICISQIAEDECNLLIRWLASEQTKLETAQLPLSDFFDN